jgi:anti-sigma regulatory factor (Ser/Thr protein kinase)
VPTSPPSAGRVFPAEPAAVAEARAWARDQCRDGGVEPDACETVRLLVSEVVTNAVQHTATPTVHVEVVIEPEVVQVCVADADPHLPLPLSLPCGAGPDDPGGRGLRLVDVLADTWGTRPLRGGKTVWFRVLRD